ncbi:MAG: hypothetical protein IT578_08295 [Verrucomicrobiae bacterium]|nr:hypothetical protein [Verrucomicrobiae bacterium]
MKNLRFLITAGTAVVCLWGAKARGDYIANFRAPPYVLDASVIGVDGWEYRFPSRANRPLAPYEARVVALRWDDEKPGLRLQGASLKRTSFGTLSSEKVQISFRLAVNFADAAPRRNKALRVIFWPETFGEIFFDDSMKGGLGYQGDGLGKPGQGTIVLPRAEIKTRSFYTFTLLLDFGKQTYDVAVTGVKKDGSPFAYKADGVEFSPSKAPVNKIETLLLLGTGYFDAFSVESR